MALRSHQSMRLARAVARGRAVAATTGSRRGVITEALTADWTKTTGSMVDELIIEDGKGAHVSPMHDIPTFPRSRVLERRFPTMWHGGRRPMVVQATVVGQRKSDDYLELDLEREGHPIKRAVTPSGAPARLTVPCEADVLVVGQTMQPAPWLRAERAAGEAELEAFASVEGYAGGALEASAALDDAAAAVRQAWSRSLDDAAEPDAAAAYPGYARQYGSGDDDAPGAEWPAGSADKDAAADEGVGPRTRELVARRRAQAAAWAATRRRPALSALRDVEGALSSQGSALVDAGAAGAPADWVWADGLLGSSGGPLPILDLTMAAARPGSVRELAVLGAMAVVRAHPHPPLRGDAPCPRSPADAWPDLALGAVRRLRGSPPPTLTVDWVLVGASLPAHEPDTAPDAIARASRSQRPAQPTSGSALDDGAGAAVRDLLAADRTSAAHDLATLYGGATPAPSWDDASPDDDAAAPASASRRTDRLLLQARVDSLAQWLESSTLGLDHLPPCSVARSPDGAPLVLGAAAAQALVFAHRAAWWRHTVAREPLGGALSGLDAAIVGSLPAPWVPAHPSSGAWHPLRLTDPSPVVAAARLAAEASAPPPRRAPGGVEIVDTTDAASWPHEGRDDAPPASLDEACEGHFGGRVEEWQESAHSAATLERVVKARRMEERPEPTVPHTA